MYKKIFLLITIIYYCMNINVIASENVGADNEFIYEEFRENINKLDIPVEIAVSKNTVPDSLWSFIKNVILNSLKGSFKPLVYILILSVMVYILKSYTEDFYKINFMYGCICAYMLLSEFTRVYTICKDSLSDLCDFMMSAFPLYLSLIAGSGYTESAFTLNGHFAVISVLISNAILKIVYPILFISGILACVAGIFSYVNLNGIVNLVSKTAKYAVGFAMTISAGITGFSGISAITADNTLMRTARYAVSNFVPVVGGCLSDTLGTIVQSGVIMKNTMGNMGLLVIIALCLSPIIKVGIVIFFFRISAVLSDSSGMEPLGLAVSSVCNVMSTLLSLLIFITVVFILFLTLIIVVG